MPSSICYPRTKKAYSKWWPEFKDCLAQSDGFQFLLLKADGRVRVNLLILFWVYFHKSLSGVSFCTRSTMGSVILSGRKIKEGQKCQRRNTKKPFTQNAFYKSSPLVRIRLLACRTASSSNGLQYLIIQFVKFMWFEASYLKSDNQEHLRTCSSAIIYALI